MYASQGLADSIPPDAVTRPVVQDEGKTCLASSEGFTWGYCNRPRMQGLLDDLHRASVRLLAKAELTDSILIMVRDPVDMVRALHEQSIKQGGVEPFEEFAQKQRGFILGPLNPALILKEYGRYFPRVVILSADELRQDPAVFWRKYSRELGVPGPLPQTRDSCRRNLAANRSLGKSIYDLARLNIHGSRFVYLLDRLQGYGEDHPREFVEFRTFCRANWPSLTRRVAEYATEEQLAVLMGEADQETRESFQRVTIDPDLARGINNRCLAPLENCGLVAPRLLDQYRSSLAQAVKG